MTKEEKIKEAYGEFYKPENIDENGWTNTATTDFLNSIPCDGKEMHIVYGHPEYWYRPKALSGLENNNGWTKCTNEQPQPSKSGNYWVTIKHMGKIILDIKYYCIERNEWEGFANVTHWQKVENPRSAVY